MNNAKIVASNTIYQLIGKAVTMVVTITITAVITRFYGVEGYGAFNLILSFPALFFIISDFGLNAIAARELSLNESLMSKYLGNIYVVRSYISLVLIAIASLSLVFLPYPLFVKIGVFIGLITILTTSYHATSNIGFQVKLRYEFSSISNAIGSLFGLITIMAIAFQKGSLVLIAIAFVLAETIKAASTYLFLRKLKIKPDFVLDKALIKNLLYTSLPLGLMFVFSQINFKADSVLLSFLKLPVSLGYNNLQTVGVYGLPYKVFEVSLVIPTFFMNSVYPIMVKSYASGEDALLRTFKKSLMVLFGLGILCAIFGLIFSPIIIRTLGGEGFNDSIYVLKVLLGFIFIFYLTQPVAYLLVVIGKQKILPFIYIIASVVNVTLNIILIPKYSFYAAAHLTWVTEAIILSLLSVSAYTYLKKA